MKHRQHSLFRKRMLCHSWAGWQSKGSNYTGIILVAVALMFIIIYDYQKIALLKVWELKTYDLREGPVGGCGFCSTETALNWPNSLNMPQPFSTWLSSSFLPLVFLIDSQDSGEQALLKSFREWFESELFNSLNLKLILPSQQPQLTSEQPHLRVPKLEWKVVDSGPPAWCAEWVHSVPRTTTCCSSLWGARNDSSCQMTGSFHPRVFHSRTASHRLFEGDLQELNYLIQFPTPSWSD